MTDGQRAYQEYLKTDKWKTIRAQRLTLDNNECVLCGDYATNVHHRRYPREWGTETISDLVSLCEGCHNAHHSTANGALWSVDDVFCVTIQQRDEQRSICGVSGCLQSLERHCDWLERGGVDPADLTIEPFLRAAAEIIREDFRKKQIKDK